MTVRTREVLLYLGFEGSELLEHLRREGLFEEEELDAGQAEELRLAAVMMQELGVNAAGVEVALQLRRRLLALETRMRALVEALEERDR